MIRVMTACAIALTLAACATRPPAPEPVIVRVPTPVPCVDKDFPRSPAYPDTAEALRGAQDHATFDRLMQAGWLIRDARLKALEAEVDRCRKP